jgi:1-acyl-sn-glycerol-3-phosphate acyltransferase
MIPVDRGAGSSGLIAMSDRAREELAARRQIVIFPEGTRRPAGAEPRYKYGIARLYAAGNVPVLPVALNSGLFWRRRSWLRPPGTIVVEVLDPIMPGLDDESFMARLQHDIETATARLIAEANSG